MDTKIRDTVLFVLIATLKQLPPSSGDFIVGQTLRVIDINMHDDMQMLNHDGIVVDADGKAGGDFMRPLFDAGFSVAVIDRRVGIYATQARAPNKARHVVIVADCISTLTK